MPYSQQRFERLGRDLDALKPLESESPSATTHCSPSVGDNDAACPTCGHVPDTHRKRQVRHLHCKSEGMVKFISELQGVLGVKGGFKRMIAEVKNLKENAEVARTEGEKRS